MTSLARRAIAASVAVVSILAVLAAWLLISSSASAVTYYVDGTLGSDANACTAPAALACKTIQGAVNKAAPSDIIEVAPGSYNENVTIPSTLPGLTLNGAQAGISVGARIAEGPLESTIDGTGGNTVVTVQASDVTIDGFSATNPTVATFAVFGIDVQSGGTNAIIQNNFFDNIATADTGPNGTAQGVYIDQGPDNVQVLANQFSNISSNRSAKGVLIGDSAAANSSDDVLVQGNIFMTITSTTRGAYAVQMNNAVGASNLFVQNNTVNGLNGGGWVHAVGIEDDAPGVQVNGNTFMGLVSPVVGGIPTATAVWFEGPDTSFPAGNVNSNNFNYTAAANAFGIAVDPALSAAGSVDGTCNWWGDLGGPGPVASGTGALVSPNVTYSPWLILPAPAGICTGGTTPTPTPLPGTGTPSPTPTPPPGLDHFKCYPVLGAGLQGDSVTLNDQFDSVSATVLPAADLCNPVQKTFNSNITPITNPDSHLMLYPIVAPAEPTRVVTIQNQFGTFNITTTDAVFLAVPTQKSPHGPPSGLSHFKCYQAAGAPLGEGTIVDLLDQFHLEPQIPLFAPEFFCNPVEKIHNSQTFPIIDPVDHLTCYRTLAMPFTTMVSTNNQFGPQNLTVTPADHLCVPSLKLAVNSMTPSPSPTLSPSPTPTVEPATQTPAPTTPVATTAPPTNSPTPTPAATTAAPTASPTPTGTPVGTPTATPAPTTPHGTGAVGGFVDVATGGDSSSGGMSTLAVFAIGIALLLAVTGLGSLAFARRRTDR
jgi:hypothetical protein